MLSKSHPAESLAQLLVRCSLAVKDTFVQPYDTAQEQLSAQAVHQLPGHCSIPHSNSTPLAMVKPHPS